MSIINVINGSRWTTDETNFLLNLWSSKNIQSQIEGTVRDAEIYRILSMKMQEAGFQRSAVQVKTRIKILKKMYREQKGKKGSAPCSGKLLFRYYQQIDRVLGDGEKEFPTSEEEAPIKIENVKSVEDPEEIMDATPSPQPSPAASDLEESSSAVIDVTPSTSYHPASAIVSHPAVTVTPHRPAPVVVSHRPATVVSSSQSFVYDLCVVGAGMFGSAAARHASANVGIKVCLIGPEEPAPHEMENREIFGSHYDEGRITSTLDEDVPTQILSRNSIKRYRELEKLSGIDFYHPVGFLWIGKTNSPSLKRVMQVADEVNHPVVDLSYNDIFKRRYPYIKLRNDDHPLLDDFGAGYINPRNMVAAQKKVARNQGCDIIDDVVHEVKPLMNGIHEIITENQGVIKARRVLICTGAFTNFKTFPMQKLQIGINKESAALLKVTFKESRRLSNMPTIVYCRPEDQLGAYILPPILYPDGHHYLKIGHCDFEKTESQKISLEEVKNWYLSKGDPGKINSLSKFLIDMLPGLKYEEITEMTCVTCHNTSGTPYIDRVSPTVTVGVVGNGKGAQYSDEVGRLAAHLSLTGQWDSELPKSHFRVMYQN